MESGAGRKFFNGVGSGNMRAKIQSFLIYSLMLLLVSGCFSNESTLFESSVVTPVASIPLPAGVTNLGTVHINEASVTEKIIALTFRGGKPATQITGTFDNSYFTFKGGSYPGTGGNCNTTEETGSCTIVINYWPLAIGVHSSILTLDFHNGLEADSRYIDLSGTTVANLSISDAGYDFGSLVVGLTANKTFTVTNDGTSNVTGLAGTGLASDIIYLGGAYPGTGGDCGATLNAAATCTIVTQYVPGSAATDSDNIQLDYSNGINAEQVTRTIIGTGLDPALLTISDGATYDYGLQVQTTNNDKTFTVTNSGDVSATAVAESGLAVPYAFKGGTYPGTGGSCTATIAVGSCTLVVTYTPITVAVHNDTMQLDYDDGVGAQNAVRAITGTGITPASLSISDGATYNYGSKVITTANDKIFTVTNSGDASATAVVETGLAAPFAFKGGSYPGTGGSCTTTIANGNCTIVATYTPTTSIVHNDTMQLAYDDGATAQNSTRAISGTGLDPAALSISDGATYNYGSKFLNVSTDKTFAITNSGDVSATTATGSGLAAPYSFKGGSYPGTGGSCTATIAVGSCTIVVTYTPTTSALHSDTIIIGFNDGAAAQTATRAITGTGQSPASLAISDGVTYDFGSRVLTIDSDKTFTVTNSGDVSATVAAGSGLVAPYIFKGGSYPGTAGTCGATITVGSCTIVVTYTPTTAAVHSDTILLGYNDGQVVQSATRAVTGTGVNPASLAISDGATYDFGSQVLTTSSDKTFTVTNSGGVSATSVTGAALVAPYNFKGGSYPGTAGTCGTTIAVGSCTIVVTYTPTTIAVHGTTIQIDYTDGAATQSATRAVTGTGQNPASLTISDGASYDFASHVLNSSTDKTFTVTNSGDVSATVVSGIGLSAPFLFKGGSYPGTAGTCGATIAVGNCTIVVTYTPTTVAVHGDTIQLDYTDGAAAQTATRAITGTGIDPALLTISDGATYDFGSKVLNVSTDKTFTVTNSGDVSATVVSGSGLAAPYTFKGGAYPGTGGNCAATIAVGSCIIVVNYTPTTVAVHSDTMQLDYTDGLAAQIATRPMTGTGQSPASLAISDGATYNFGSQVLTTATDKTFTITNGGDVSATVVSGGGLAAPYIFKGGSYPGTAGTCGATIAVGSCTIVVTYTPTTAATHNDTIEISYTDGLAGQLASRAITGVGQNPAVLTISDGATYDYGNQSQLTDTDKTFTITNGGDVSATTVSGSGLVAPFIFKGGTYPGTAGTCTATIAVGSCTIVVTYTPTTLAVHNDTIQIDYTDGVAAQIATRAVTGTGIAKMLAFEDWDQFDFEQRSLGSTNDQLFTITNSSFEKMKNLEISQMNAPFTVKDGSCKKTLKSMESCQIVVSYYPTKVGESKAQLLISFREGRNTKRLQKEISGEGHYLEGSPLLLNLINTQEIKRKKITKSPQFKKLEKEIKPISLQGDEKGDTFGATNLYLQNDSQILVGAPTSDGDGESRGVIYVYNSIDGSEEFTIQGTKDNSYIGLGVHILGDVDDDGHEDLLVANYELDGELVQIKGVDCFSGIDGEKISLDNGVTEE